MFSVPRPGHKGVVLKIMRRPCFHGLGGRSFWEQPPDLLPCRGDRLVAHRPPILRKRGSNSGEKHFPADAFCARRPCARASS